MWTMEPVRELTIVRISFNLSPQERQVLCVVSLSKTATFSARNKSMIAPQSGCREWFARCREKPTRLLGQKSLSVGALPSGIGVGPGRVFQIPVLVGGFAVRHLMAKVMRGSNAATQDVPDVCHKLVPM
jgi:hypothetical protein